MERNHSIDFVKFFSIYFVICLHVFLVVNNGRELRILYFLVNYFPRFIIPYFFICSGYFWGLKCKYSSNPYFKKFLAKLSGMFIFWYLFYFFYGCFINIITSEYLQENVKISLINYIESQWRFSVLYYGDASTSFHLWFLTALIWSHIILFAFIKMKKIPLLICISLILNVMGLFGQTYSGIFHLPFQTRDALFFGLFYTAFGYYISQRNDSLILKLQSIKSTYLITLFFIFSGIQVLERYLTIAFLNGTKGEVDYFLSSIPLSFCLFFITLKHSTFGKKTIFSSVGKNVGEIYVIHMFFISLIGLTINYFNLEFLYNSFLFYVLFTLIVFFLSYIFSSFLYLVLHQSNKIRLFS
ncbi:MAG: acyltransferase family protein [Heyndrickxia sp.]